MPDATAGRDNDIIAELNDLLQLDHDAVQAYTVAIDVVRDETLRESLVEFRADHKRHIEQLAALVRARGAVPTELPHPTAPLKLAVQALGAMPGDTSLLLAFKAVEGQVRDKYARFAARSFPDDAADVIRRAAQDENRHYAWVEGALQKLGAGKGTIPHGVARMVEGIHKLVADPLEALERQVMGAAQDIAGMAGRAGSRGGSGAAPSSATSSASSTSSSSSSAPSSPPPTDRSARVAGGAQQFVEALRLVEDRGDVDAMVALFHADAEASNPTHAEPLRGESGVRHFWTAYRDAFDEVRSEFSKIVEGPDGTAMLEWTSRGRLRGGEGFSYSGVTVLELRDGRVRRFRAYFDPAQLVERARPG
jgi:ketosteroid isomerase-like protein/rubrerythrin